MTENEAWELYKKRRNARFRGRGLRKDADGNWITIKGTHVHINEEGDIEGRVADKIKATSKKVKDRITEVGAPSSDDDFEREGYQKNAEGHWEKSGSQKKKLELSKTSKPKNSDYDLNAFDDFNTFSHNNIDKLMPIYEAGGRKAIVEEKYKALMDKATTGLHELNGIEEIDADINKGTSISDSQYKHWVNQWYAGQDNTYRGLLAENALSSPEVRNAALNLAYYMCKQERMTDLPFEEWLVTPMKMYRGGKGEEHRHSGKDDQDRDFCTSFSFRRDTAESFAQKHGGRLTTIDIRPIDTIGSPGMYGSGECEILVPRWMISETRIDGARVDADEDERNTSNSSGGHGNTKIPFGLCQREGIKVQTGWTPQDAWKALEGKGYNVSDVYKKLKKQGSTREITGSGKETSPTDFVKTEIVKTAIGKREEDIRHRRVEVATAVDKDGKTLFTTSDSDVGSVDITRYRDSLKDSVFTHNHPGGRNFSPEDISSAVVCGMAEMRACHRNGAYSLRRLYSLDGEKPEGYKNFAWEYQEAKEKYTREVTDPIWNEGPKTGELADKCNGMVEKWRSQWLTENSKRFGWEYTEEKK